MMARGLLLDDNLVDLAVFGGPEGAWTLPLDNLKSPRLHSLPARCEHGGDENLSRFWLSFERTRTVSAIAVVNHGLQLDGVWEVLAFSDPARETQIYGSGQMAICPPWFSTLEMAWGHPNWWSGRPEPRDIRGYTPNLILVLPEPLPARAWEFRFLDPTAPAAWFDLGYLMMSDALTPEFNFTFGRELSADLRDLIDRTAGGADIAQPMRPARTQTVTFGHLTRREAVRIYDGLVRGRQVDPVFFVPDPAAALDLHREAFLARRRSPPRIRQIEVDEWSVTCEFEEIVA